MWEQAVRTTLKAINKLAFIDGELSRPENKDGKQIAGVNTWDMVNSIITSWIMNMIDLKQMLEQCVLTRHSRCGEAFERGILF